MRIPISEITVNARQRQAVPADVRELADSISELGLLNPVTVDCAHTLIAGLHRLEAAKLLGWVEIECTVSNLEGLQAELAEIDENFVRADLSTISFGNLLLRRKEIYETLHPETKAGIEQAAGMNLALGNNVTAQSAATLKSFVEDTSEKLGIAPRTVREQIQIAKNLTPETKRIIQSADVKVRKKDAIKLSRLQPEQQESAAVQLTAKKIKSVDEYQPPPQEQEEKPYSLGDKHFATLEESIADLKDPNKDCHYTLDAMLADMDGFVDRFHRDFEWYSMPVCTDLYPQMSQVQYEFIQRRFHAITTTIENLLQMIGKEINNVSS